MKKKIVATVCAIAVVFANAGLAPVESFREYGGAVTARAETLTYGDYYYQVESNGEITITGVTDKDITVANVPAEIDGKPVTKLCEAFYDCKLLTSVTLPEGLKEINSVSGYYNTYGSFSGCSLLTQISIPKSVKKIDNYTFSGCSSLTKVLFSEDTHLNVIDKGAFSNCISLNSFNVPYGVTKLGDYAFEGCSSMLDISLPDSLVLIGTNVFEDCISLKKAIVPKNITLLSQGIFKNCSGLKDVSLPEGITIIGPESFNGCAALNGITIPKTVVKIENSAFSGCISLKKIEIPSNVINIGDSVFSNCRSLSKVILNEGIVNIGSGVFNNCDSLSEIIFPNSVTKIESGESYSTLGECELLELVIFPNELSVINCGFFEGSNINKVFIPKSVTQIYDCAFPSGSNNWHNSTTVKEVYFEGTQEEWNKILIDGDNGALNNAHINYNSKPEDLSTSDNSARGNEIDWGYQNKDGSWSGVDNLSFTNSRKNFYGASDRGFWRTINILNPGYYMTTEDYNKLTNGLSDSVKEILTQQMCSDWGGSCYGMSVAVSLMKTGYLKASNYQMNAKTAHDISSIPKDNRKLESMISFYHLQQFLPDAQAITKNLPKVGDDFTAHHTKLINEVKKVENGGMPVVLGIYWQRYGNNNKIENVGHAVVAYRVEEGAFPANNPIYKYRVSVYDPNTLKYEYIYFRDDLSTSESWHYDGLSTYSGGNSKVVPNSQRIGDIISDYKDIELIGYENNANNTRKTDYGNRVVNSINNSVSSISSNGKYTDISAVSNRNGLNANIIPSSGITADGETSGSCMVFLPDDDAEYTITPTDKALDVSMLNDGNFVALNADDIALATFSSDGKIEMEINSGKFAIDSTFDEENTELPWSTMLTEGEGKGKISLEMTDDKKGMILSGDNLKNVTVSARNASDIKISESNSEPTDIADIPSIAFSTEKNKVFINSSDSNSITVYEDKDDDGSFETLIAYSENAGNKDTGAILGDINNDGKINVTDVSKTAAHVKGIKSLDVNAQKSADVNGDGKINVTDVSKIAAHVKGIKPLN